MDITQEKVVEALETTFGQEGIMHEPNHARKEHFVDEDTAEHYEEEFYTGEPEDEPNEHDQACQAEDDETWHDCDESHYQRDPSSSRARPRRVRRSLRGRPTRTKRFNDLKLARGFYPVVAMVGGSP
eukprot:5603984-Pyramimonas_sp.AAC.1